MKELSDKLLEWGYLLRDRVLASKAHEQLKSPLLRRTEKWLDDMQRTEERLDNDQEKAWYEVAHNLYDEWRNLQENTTSVPIGEHTLPPLPYKYNALEPAISARIMELHHDIHHKSYVDGLNKAELALQEARKNNDFDLIKHWERELAFNGAGHYLHTLFWSVMSPKGGKPDSELLSAIQESFGSFKQFKQQFTNAANKVEGSGWAILVWSPVSRRLEILQAEKHQNLSQWDIVPLLAIDVWEHAYYLQYENKRKQYIENWWSIVNWSEVNKRFAKARQLTWKPF
ncbi:superoxide dismutase [Bacillus hwajinpoensis]|uniref:superoxide dismutase n=1 Tax=Guptibacillus hwajinpoensis TaxID=208199 RepID=A0A845F1K1_9BACL|nr:superoxide dismutase [Pseudalkalibacillus hwajinpoensis]MYL64670.1 superoxide dismutase [Pseudalkalibacillus hwajinpoensis]